jgi:hypothetical protein
MPLVELPLVALELTLYDRLEVVDVTGDDEVPDGGRA